jgi:hypothetical protein
MDPKSHTGRKGEAVASRNLGFLIGELWRVYCQNAENCGGCNENEENFRARIVAELVFKKPCVFSKWSESA